MKFKNTRSGVLLAGFLAYGIAAATHFHGDHAYVRRLNLSAPDRITAGPERLLVSGRETSPVRRLWVVIVDGLGYDHASRLLADPAWTSRVLLVDFPSFTSSGLTTLATGIPPERSGVRINGKPPFPASNSISRRAWAEGIPVRIAKEDFEDLPALLQLPKEATESSREELFSPSRSAERELAWIYIADVDEAGHKTGARSKEYLEATRRAESVIARAAARLDPRQDVLVVLSDHGHLPMGGHGGDEPAVLRALFLARGPGFVPGGRSPARMRDVAAIIASSLRIPAPDGSRMEPMRNRQDGSGSARRLMIAAAIAALVTVVLRLAAGMTSHDARPALVYMTCFAILYTVAGHGMTWSVRSEVSFYLETLIAGSVSAGIAWTTSRRARRLPETLATCVLLGTPYLLASAWVGLDPSQLAAPRPSFAVVMLGTMAFYGCLGASIPAVLQGLHRSVRRGVFLAP